MILEVRPELVDVVTPGYLRDSYAEQQLWTTSTLSESVSRNASNRPERVAVVDCNGSRQVSFAELDAEIDRFAHHLNSIGIGAGDAVAVALPNCLEAVVADLAVLRVGAILNPMITGYRDRELEYMLRLIGTKLLVNAGMYRGFDHAAMAERLSQQVPGLANHVLAPGSLTPADSGSAKRWQGPPREFGAVSMVLFSSGTESTPKAIMHTEQTTGAATAAARSAVNLAETDVVWTPTPIGHSTGFNYGVRIALEAGLPLILQDRWNSSEAIRLIQNFGCSFTVGVPTILRDLIDQCRTERTTLPSMRLFYTGGAPVAPALVAEGDEFGIGVYRLYGSTETLAATLTRPDYPVELRAHTDGTALPGVEVEIRPLNGGDDGQGEVYVRSPAASVGFARDPERTSQVFDDHGWVQTGDLADLHPTGHLTIVGRAKEILIRGGMNIAPREIEDLLQQHPNIAEVAVVGLPDLRLGERCCAVVVLESNTTVSLEEIVTYLRDTGLASYKLPEQLVIRDGLPLNASGKVQKKVLVQLISASS